MIETLLVALPSALGLACFFLGRGRSSRILLVGGAAIHAALTGWAWATTGGGGSSGGVWLGLDALGLLFLTTTSLLFLVVSIYTVGFLARERGGEHADPIEGVAA